ncbi:hypothetical protein VTK56DRAFT_8665 [Thermocarpiscus australiensis]
MLRRRLVSSASFVCLRCRLQLAGAPQHLPLPAAFSYVPVRSHQRRINTDAADAPAPSADEQNARVNEETSSETEGHNEGIPLSQNHLYKSRGHLLSHAKVNEETSGETEGHNEGIPLPQSRLYKSRGHFLSPEQEGLSVEILGKPASAIVMREANVVKSRKYPTLESDDSAKLPQADLAGLIPNEITDAVSDEDILLNIHELQPKDTRILTENEFNALKSTLTEGFTVAQLESYVDRWQEVQPFLQEEAPASEDPPWVLERRPWVPVVENAVQDIEPQLYGYVTQDMPPKERLAIRLMRQCWNLSYHEIFEQHGYLDVRLRDTEFSLLMLGNRRWLADISRAFLEPGKQIELFRQSHFVSILAPKPEAEAILDRINQVLENARTAHLSVDLVSPNTLEPAVLEQVGTMTNTIVRLDPTGKTIEVTWIHLPDRNENFENSGETVLRLLRDAFGPKPRVSSTLEIVPSSLAHGGRYLTELNCAQKLPWHERLNRWERWTAALPQSKSGSQAPPETLLPNTLPFPLQSADPITEPEDLFNSAPNWSLEPRTDTSAVFGHVVFARQKPSSSSVARLDPALQFEPSLPRTFVPILPALGNLDLPSNLQEEGLWHTTIVIRFIPAPDIASDLVNSAPDLELRLEADHREIKRIVSLRAVTDTFTGDVLSPASAVDARLLQTRYFTLPGTSVEQRAQPILTFLSKSDLRPWDGKLTTPHSLDGMRLPRRLLSPTDRSGAAAGNEEADPAAVVDYIFASIEVQRTVAAEYKGLKLRYTSIEGGQRGGRRSELSLEAVRVETEKKPLSSEEAEDADEYELVDETDSRSRFTFHTMNKGEKSREPQTPAKPVDVDEFMQVASGIVNGTGRLTWHAT